MSLLQEAEDGERVPTRALRPCAHLVLQKCDGQRPICAQCVKANRDTECQYHDKKQVSRTEMLRAKVAKLEARLRELEVEHSESSSGGGTPGLSPEPSCSSSSPEIGLYMPSSGES